MAASLGITTSPSRATQVSVSASGRPDRWRMCTLAPIRAALKEQGLDPSPDLTLYLPAREEDGYQTTGRLLALPIPPDAIMTSNGLLAAGAFRALREKRVPVPGQLAFASFDETPWSTLVKPPITVIEQPTYEIGRTAIELLLKRIQDPSCSCKEVILKSRLRVRRSCGCSGE
jgi:LacI family transcriptional regulator, fructose operon transcriptional repressor